MPGLRRAALGIVAVAAFAAAAHAGDRTPPKPSPLDEPRLLAHKGDALGAAKSYGALVAKAQASGDLALEDAAAQGLEALLDAAPEDAAAGSKETQSAVARSTLLRAVMEKLDANRCGAFVSAPCLARAILESATRTGVTTDVAAASAVLQAHATKSTSGRAAPVVAKYAEGMKALLADGSAAAAAPVLEAAASAAVKAGWSHLAACAATEAAAAWTKAGDAAKALAIVQSTADAIDGSYGPMLIEAWGKTLAGRIPKDDALLAALDDLMKRAGAAAMTGNEAGTASPGLAGDAKGTPFALFFEKLAKGKPIATARGTASGFDARFAMSPDKKPSVPRATCVTYTDDGGTWLAFQGRSVALVGLDLRGGHAGANGRWSMSPVRASYLVAEGETWTVSREGVVTITK